MSLAYFAQHKDLLTTGREVSFQAQNFLRSCLQMFIATIWFWETPTH